MKRFFFIVAAVLCVSCSPQRQLARLLASYPELKRDSVVVLRDTTITAYAQATTTFTIEDLNQMLQASRANDTLDLSKADHKTGITAVADHARASIVAENGKLKLIAEQTPDTIVLEQTVTIPVYTTEVKEKELTGWQRFKISIGSTCLGILACGLIFFFVRWVMKRFKI